MPKDRFTNKSFYVYNYPFADHQHTRQTKTCAPITNKTIAVISPHSDDISISCGATMSLLSTTNTIFPILLFTGYRGVLSQTKDLGNIREQEMYNEAALLGLNPPLFLRLASYEATNQSVIDQDNARIQKTILEINPSILFLPYQKDCHPRHHLATALTLQALKNINSSITLFFYETSWHTFGPFDFNAGFVFDASLMAKKLEAIRVHVSQLKRTAFDCAAQCLAQFRACMVPEQRMYGYGNQHEQNIVNQAGFMEVFLRKTIRKRS